jgi:hypothetical protein
MRPQIKALEHHAEPGANALHLAYVGGNHVAPAPRLEAHLFARDGNAALTWQFEQVDTAQERTLSRTARPDDRDNIAFPRGQGHAFLNLKFAEALMQVFNGHRGFGNARVPDSRGGFGRHSATSHHCARWSC